MHSSQRALERYGKLNAGTLQKESLESNDNDIFNENGNLEKSDDKVKEKEEEKDQPSEKVKSVGKFEFLGKKFELEY
jgi:hypothetical protein